jgi:hypothetical protein
MRDRRDRQVKEEGETPVEKQPTSSIPSVLVPLMTTATVLLVVIGLFISTLNLATSQAAGRASAELAWLSNVVAFFVVGMSAAVQRMRWARQYVEVRVAQLLQEREGKKSES